MSRENQGARRVPHGCPAHEIPRRWADLSAWFHARRGERAWPSVAVDGLDGDGDSSASARPQVVWPAKRSSAPAALSPLHHRCLAHCGLQTGTGTSRACSARGMSSCRWFASSGRRCVSNITAAVRSPKSDRPRPPLGSRVLVMSPDWAHPARRDTAVLSFEPRSTGGVPSSRSPNASAAHSDLRPCLASGCRIRTRRR